VPARQRLIAVCVVGVLTITLAVTTGRSSGEAAEGGVKAVHYEGFTFRVPAAWSVLSGSRYQGCVVKGPAVVVGEEPAVMTCSGSVVQSATVVRISLVPTNEPIEAVAGPSNTFHHRGVSGTLVVGTPLYSETALGAEAGPGTTTVPPLGRSSPGWALDARFSHSHVQFGANGFGGVTGPSERQVRAILLGVTWSPSHR
jgi:hypothetical protein